MCILLLWLLTNIFSPREFERLIYSANYNAKAFSRDHLANISIYFSKRKGSLNGGGECQIKFMYHKYRLKL